MTTLTFEFQRDGGTERRDVAIRDLVIAGWTGRDPHKVQEHVEELRLLGVAPPPGTPCFYRAGASLLTTAPAIDCLGGASSGEAEFIILVAEDGGWWVGAGSDHTDREVESYSIPVSKQLCPKPVAPMLWRFEEVADHWDRLELHAWVEEDGGRATYQQGSVAAMLDPRATAAAWRALGHDLTPGTIMFGGTLPVIGGIRPRHRFTFSLRDPLRGRAITHGYAARWLTD